jgi:murein DD-endopeptidase MepM/ murein hydrolase activator NlpD
MAQPGLNIVVPSLSLQKFMQTVQKLQDFTNKVAKTQTLIPQSTIMQSAQGSAQVLGQMRRLPALFYKFDATLVRSIENMLRRFSPRAQSFVRLLVIPEEIFSGLKSITTIAGFARLAGPAGLAAFAVFKVMKWIFDKSIALMESVQRDRIQALMMGTTVGNLRAFRAAFWMFPDDPVLANAISQLRGAAGSVASLQLTGTFGVPRNIDPVEQMAQQLIRAQKFLQKFPGQEVTASREFGAQIDPTTLRILMDPTTTQAKLRERAAKLVQLEKLTKVSPQEQQKILDFLNEKEILLATVRAQFLKSIADSGLASGLTRLSESLTRWFSSFGTPSDKTKTTPSATHGIAARVVGRAAAVARGGAARSAAPGGFPGGRVGGGAGVGGGGAPGRSGGGGGGVRQRGGGDGGGGGVFPGIGGVGGDLPPEQKAFLDAIAGGEETGYFNRPNRIGAFGRYQFIPSTLRATAAALYRQEGFNSPEEYIAAFHRDKGVQDRAALWLASKDYRRITGRDLYTDLKSSDPAVRQSVFRALNRTWTSLPGGKEQNREGARAPQRFEKALEQYGHPIAAPPSGGATPTEAAPPPGGDRLRQPITATGIGGGVGDPRGGHTHQGVDVLAPAGSPIYSTFSGTIVRHNPHGSFQGDAVTIIQSDTGEFYSVYMHHHIDPSLIGKHVEAGQQIGTSGGANGVDHLHFEFWHGHPWRSGSQRYNPEQVFEWHRRGQMPKGGAYVHPPPPPIETAPKPNPPQQPPAGNLKDVPAAKGDKLTQKILKNLKITNRSDAAVQIIWAGKAGSNIGNTMIT